MDINSGGADSSPARVIARSRLFRPLIESPGCISCAEGSVDEFGCVGQEVHHHETLYV